MFDLVTSRLCARPLRAADVAALHALWTNADVRQFLWDGELIPLARTEAIVGESERLFACERRGLWGAWTRAEERLCGFAGYWCFRDPPELELLYGLGREFWGLGFATELAAEIMAYGIHQLGMRDIRASTDASNQASVRVLERLGFTLERRAVIDRLDTLFFTFTHRESPSAR